METSDITPNLKLINLQPPLPGYERFFASYLFCSERKAIIETGPSICAPNLLSSLDGLGIGRGEIDYIILTHIHIDHGGGVGTAHRGMPQAKVIAHSQAHRHLADPSRLWESSKKVLGELALKYGNIEPVPEGSIIDAEDGMRLDLGGGLALEVLLTPGHAAHHISIFEPAKRVLVAGEAAGVCVDNHLRVTTPPPFRLDVILSSIDRLIALEPRRICYSHFGCYDDAPGKLRRIRQKVLDWSGFCQKQARAGKSAEEVFGMLREWDRELDYLDGLTRDQFGREYALLLNSVKGLCEPAPDEK
jgi:glyoxylase-like metal-dependent hydrolase (beta-lactamase superfamily II)